MSVMAEKAPAVSRGLAGTQKRAGGQLLPSNVAFHNPFSLPSFWATLKRWTGSFPTELGGGCKNKTGSDCAHAECLDQTPLPQFPSGTRSCTASLILCGRIPHHNFLVPNPCPPPAPPAQTRPGPHGPLGEVWGEEGWGMGDWGGGAGGHLSATIGHVCRGGGGDAREAPQRWAWGKLC